jgi:hypothetical protein
VSRANRPWFARLLARASRIEARKGGDEHRRRLLSGLEGRIVEIGAGTGNNFGFYPSSVTLVVAVERPARPGASAVLRARALATSGGGVPPASAQRQRVAAGHGRVPSRPADRGDHRHRRLRDRIV